MERPRRPLLTLKFQPQEQGQTPTRTPATATPIKTAAGTLPSSPALVGARRPKSNRINPDIFRRAAAAAASAVESLIADREWRDAGLHASYRAAKSVAKPRHRVHAKLVATVTVRRLAPKDADAPFIDLATRAAYAAAMTVVIEDPNPR